MNHEAAQPTSNFYPTARGKVEELRFSEALQIAHNSLTQPETVEEASALKLSGEKQAARVDLTADLLERNDFYLRLGTEDQEQLFQLVHINDLIERLKQGESIKIGRSQDATIRFDSKLVSANHAELRYDAEHDAVMVGVIATNASLLLQVPKTDKETEPSSEITPRTELLEEVGAVATGEVVEAAEEIKKPTVTEAQKYEKELQSAMMYDIYTLRNIVQQGDIQYFSQYLTVFSQKVSEFRIAHPESVDEANNLDGAIQTMHTQLSLDMQSGRLNSHAYEDVLGKLEVLILSR